MCFTDRRGKTSQLCPLALGWIPTDHFLLDYEGFILHLVSLFQLRGWLSLDLSEFFPELSSETEFFPSVFMFLIMCVCACTHTHMCMYSFYINKYINTCVIIFHDRLLLYRHMNILMYFVSLPWDESDTNSSYFWIQ